MRTKSILLGTAAVLVLAAQPASASHFNGWYIGIEGGASWVDDFDATLATTFVAFTPTFTAGADGTFFGASRARTDLDTGWTVLATVGYGFGGGFRAEFEAGYRDNDGGGNLSFRTPTPLATPFTGLTTVTAPYAVDLTEVTLMANVLYDISFGDRMSLSLGGGVGADQLDYDVSAFGLSAGDTEWKFAWQLIAGLNYRVGSQTALYVNYRYLQVENVNNQFFPDVAVFGDSFQDATLITDENIVKHAVTLGLRFDLAPDYVAAPPAPPPPPPPPAPPPPKDFIVFFGFDKSNLTAEAAQIVQQAAQAFKETGAANVKVVGHTDRAGSDEYNQALSMRRANTVRGGLVAEGVPDGSISVDGRGESEPMVSTDDGVREPQNRRVNITF